MCYTDPVANLTIAVDDDLLRRARVRAATEGTSVNAVLRMELERWVGHSADEALEALFSRKRTIGNPGGASGWTREGLYAERLNRPVKDAS